MNINLHIDRLILEGLPIGSGQQRSLQIAVQLELARLMATSDLSPAFSKGGSVPEATTSPVQLSGQPNPIQLGRQIARSVHQGLSGGPTNKR